MSPENPTPFSQNDPERHMSLWDRYQKRREAVKIADELYNNASSFDETVRAIERRDAAQAVLDDFVETYGVPDEPPRPKP